MSDLPRGLQNKNPLNLGYVQGQPGVIGSDGRFGIYATMDDGINAAINQLKIYQTRDGLTTPRQMISKWAPSSENNTSSYVNTVAKLSGLDPDKPVDLGNQAQVAALVRSMARVENGRDLGSGVTIRVSGGAPPSGAFNPLMPQAPAASWVPPPPSDAQAPTPNPLMDPAFLLAGLAPTHQAIRVDYDPWAVAPKL